MAAIAAMSWMDVEAWLARDDRAVLPIGSTEQHAGLSLATDAILAARVAEDAAAPLGVPVLPAIPFGVAPYFLAYPGSVSLRITTLLAVVEDVLESLARQGFRRIVIVSGHGGNAPVGAFAQEWLARKPGVQVRFHEWWKAPRTWARAMAADPTGSHGNWLESFPWTRLHHRPAPNAIKTPVAASTLRGIGPDAVRAALGDGSFGGRYQHDEATMQAIWEEGVAETREAIEHGW